MISVQFRSNAARGFTLLELLTVVAIVAILATIAIPNYSDYVQRSRISDATTALSDFRVRMEQFYLDNRRYTTAAGSAKCGIADPVLGGGESFGIACTAANDNSYLVTATGQAAKNMNGFVYTIDQNGNKATVSVGAGWSKTATCWTIRKDGSCS